MFQALKAYRVYVVYGTYFLAFIYWIRKEKTVKVDYAELRFGC